MPSLRTLAASAILLAALVPAAAAAQSFYDAVSAQRWGEAAALVEPWSAARYQRNELNQMAFFRAHGNRARALRLDTMSSAQAEAVIQSDPQFPRSAEAMHGPAFDSISVNVFSGTRTIGELRAMPAMEFLTRALEHTGSVLSITPGEEPGEGTAPTIVGHVIEHDTAAFVLYRKAPSEFDEGPRADPEGSVETLYLRRDGGRWRLVLTSAITPSLGMALAVDEIDFDAAPAEDGAP